MKSVENYGNLEQLKKELCNSITQAKDLKELVKITERNLRLVISNTYRKKILKSGSPWTSFNWSTRTYNTIAKALEYQKKEWIEDFDEFPDMATGDLPLVMVADILTINLLQRVQGAGAKTFKEIDDTFKKYGLSLEKGRAYSVYRDSSYREYIFRLNTRFNQLSR